MRDDTKLRRLSLAGRKHRTSIEGMAGQYFNVLWAKMMKDVMMFLFACGVDFIRIEQNTLAI